MVDLQALGQGERLGGFERCVERPDAVGVEVVHDQHDGVGVGVVHAQQAFDLVGPVDLVRRGWASTWRQPRSGSTQTKIEQVPQRRYSWSSMRSRPAVAGIGSRVWSRSW